MEVNALSPNNKSEEDAPENSVNMNEDVGIFMEVVAPS